MATLAALPADVLQEVSEHLPTPDVGALRLTCTAVNAALADNYRKYHFTQLSVVVSPAGLAALADLARHSDVGVLVRSLRLLPHTAPDILRAQNALLSVTDERDADVDADTATSLPCPRDMPLSHELARVLAILPQLRTLQVSDGMELKLRTRAADWGLFSGWCKPLGHAEPPASSAVFANALDKRRLGPIFRAALLSLGLAHAHRVGAGYRPVRELLAHGKTTLDDDVFKLDDDQRALFAPALATLDGLHLAFGRCSSSAAGLEPCSAQQAVWTHAVAFMRLCNPSSLALRAVEIGGHGPYGACIPSTLSWMLGADPPLSRLRHLSLAGYCDLDAAMLFELLVGLEHLERVTLDAVGLRTGREPDDVDMRMLLRMGYLEGRAPTNKDEWDGMAWRTLLRDLSARHRAAPLSITEMHLRYIVECTCVRFATGRKRHEEAVSAYATDSGVHFPNAVQGKVYRDMPAGGDLFARLAESIQTPWSEPDSDGGSESEGEGEREWQWKKDEQLAVWTS